MVIDNPEVDAGLKCGEFVPHFQPLVHLRTGALQGFELLARWNHPQRGLVSPDEFIPIAETHGWIGALTRELLREGFRTLAALPGEPMLAINISPVQLHDLTLPSVVRHLAEDAGFPLDHLILEVTESALTHDLESARTIAHAFKDMGCKLALDDFGTGYSSLSHLQSLPFDELKVDRSFVGTMIEQRDSRKIVAAVVGLGQSLGLTTVAEGVATADQAEMLLWLGCELAQGWHYGRPAPAADLPALIDRLARNVSTSPPPEVAGRVSLASLEALPSQRFSQLQAVYDGAPVGLAFIDRNLRYMNLNRRLARMNGQAIEEHLGRTVAEMIPDLFPIVEPFIRRALNGEAISGIEITKPPASRGASSIMVSYEPARDEAGEVVGVSVAIVDLTPIKRFEKAVRESEENLRYMMELLPPIPWVIDAQGRAIDVSERWLELTGMTGDQWRGYGWMDALHPDDRQPTWDAMLDAFATAASIDIVYRVRQSSTSPWKRMRSRGSPRLTPEGRIVCWYGCLDALD
ncbi:MAG: EAL domain-containing protein [Acidobacteriota bacterium]